MSVNRHQDLRARVDARFDELIQRFYQEVPWATHFLSGEKIDLDYYKRHNIETILRIRRKRTVDAYAIRYFTLNDPRAAAAWCKYTEDEMLHDHMFLRDLQKVGVTADEAYATEPMQATKMMMGYLLYGMEYDGTPLALLTSVYLMEYVTVLTQPGWLDNVASDLGDQHVAGARAHVGTDVDEGHADFVWKVLVTLLRDETDERRMFAHIDALYDLWAAYFTELHDHTVGARSTEPGGGARSRSEPGPDAVVPAESAAVAG
jgi:hypothetical protein